LIARCQTGRQVSQGWSRDHQGPHQAGCQDSWRRDQRGL